MQYLATYGPAARRFPSPAHALTWVDFKRRERAAAETGSLPWYMEVVDESGTVRPATREEYATAARVELEHVLCALDTTAIGKAYEQGAHGGRIGLLAYIGDTLELIAGDGERGGQAAGASRFMAEAGQLRDFFEGSDEASWRTVRAVCTLLESLGRGGVTTPSPQ